MKKIICGSIIFFVTGCSTIVLQSADFSWPVESVLEINSDGSISEERHTFNINIKPIFYEEFNDSTSYPGKAIRIIRDKYGYYFFTSEGFKNVYMFYSIEGGMRLKNKFNVSDSITLKKPIFNQKPNGIELIDGSKKYLINRIEIVRVK